MAQCDISNESVARGIKSYATRQMEFSGKFDREEDFFVPKENAIDYQSVVDDINLSFSEELVSRFGIEPIYGITEPSETLIRKYLKPSIEQIKGKSLSDKEDEEFVKLQKLGLISSDSNIVNGKEYYKIPGGKNIDKYNRLSSIIRGRDLGFINIIDSPDNFLIQLGRVEKVPQEYDKVTSTKASPITKARVLKFLNNIGFTNIQEVSNLIYKGEKIKGSSYIDFTNGVMQIVEGTEDYVLPEESMHILTTLIKQSRPALFARMKKDIINYNIYRSIVNDPDYNQNPLYRNEEGNLNYEKLKEEAIAKILAEQLIQEEEKTQESARRLEEVRNWWQQIVHWIREKFGLYKNPFKEALEEINRDDTSFGEFADISSDDIFLSAKSLDTIDRENLGTKEMWESIKNRPNTENIYKIDNEYFKGDQKIPDAQRVSDLVDRYYKKLFGSRNFDESLKEFYEQSRKDGSYIHEIFEELINSYIDPDTGLMRKNPTPINFPLDGNPIQGKIVSDARKFIKQFMSSFPEGTRFLTEQIIYDPSAINSDKSIGRFGTIDFMAITPTEEGPRVDIIDWKSMLLEDLEGAKDYKRGAIFVQLNEYSRILKDVYGVERFGKIRAIPIKKHYKTDKVTKKKEIQNIEIGSVDASKITSSERYLRPIISPEETTGSETRDELIKKLEALYQKYIDRGYFQDNRNILNEVQEAVYEIRVSNTVNNLTNYFTDLSTKFRQSLSEIEKMKDAKKEDISEALSMLSFYQDIVTNVVEPSLALIEDTSISLPDRSKLQDITSKLLIINRKIDSSRSTLLDALAKKDGIFGLLLPEKIINVFKRYLRSMGSQDIASVRYAYELVKKAFNRINISTDDDLRELKNLKFNFDEWRKGKNLTVKEATSKLINFSKGRIHSKISQNFFDRRKEVIESRDEKAILKFVKENYNLQEYLDWYTKTLEENKKIWEASEYDPDPKKNNLIIKGKLETFAKNYNITAFPLTAYGYHNPKIWGRNIKEELWLSDEYKEIEKEKPLLDMYNFMLSKNKQLSQSGAIKDLQQYTFFPNVRKTFADVVSFEDSSTLEKARDLTVNAYNNFRKSLTVEDYELNYQGARDPFTGEKLEKRFIPYINEIGVTEQSFDLFTVYGLMSKEINREKYLKENDEILRSLVHLERMKPNLESNKFGTLSIDSNGRAQESKQIGKNAAVLEEHVRSIVNGESLQVNADFVAQFRLRELWNKTPLAKLHQFDTSPETYKPTSISMTKFVMWLNNANQRRVLGLNAASAISNLFGGSYASNRLYKKYIGEGDINKSAIKNAWNKLTSGGFYQSDEMKKNAALVDYFLPLLNNRDSFQASQLSVNKAATVLSQEWLMAPMRKTSEIVQLNIFLAVIENTGLIDGKIVNLREKAAQDVDYYNRYSKSPEQVKEIENNLEKRLKEYKDKYSLVKLAQFKTIKEGGKDKVIIDIPGIERSGEDVANLRDIVQTMSKDALGEADEYDLANYKYNIWWRLFMTFKNWIPRQIDVRFGEFRYDQAHHSHEYGRFRMFARALTANLAQTILKTVPLPYITGKLTNSLSKQPLVERAREVYQKKIQEAKRLGKYDRDTFISEGEFVDRFIKGVDSTFAELRTIILMNLLLFVGLAAPDDDDDSETRGIKALIRKQVDKLSDEVGFFYSPKSGIDIAGGGPPIVSLIRDVWYLGTNTTEQFFGFGLEQLGWDEKGLKMQETAKPIKRTFKVFPVLKEILTYLPAFDEELSKEWGVRVNDRRGF